MNSVDTIEIGLPSGGQSKQTKALFRAAGMPIPTTNSRQLSFTPEELNWSSANNTKFAVTLLKTGEIPDLMQSGTLDIGITSSDYRAEYEALLAANGIEPAFNSLLSLNYSRNTQGTTDAVPCSRIELFVPEQSPLTTVSDLQGAVIDSERPWLTKAFLSKKGVESEIAGFDPERLPTALSIRSILERGLTAIKPTKGSSEALPNLRSRRGIEKSAAVAVTETGSTINANKQRTLEVIMNNTMDLIMSRLKPDIANIGNEIKIKLSSTSLPSERLAHT